MEIEKELVPDLPGVMLDRQQIKQVFLNLFLNALDAMSEKGGVLRVRTSLLAKPGGRPWVRIETEDTGQGISQANLEHIFDPFFTTKHESGEHEGTGFGLTIVHQIIEEHQGDIQVKSVAGAGTTFLVNLPGDPFMTSKNGIESNVRKRVLLVDDEARVRASSKAVLEPTYEVIRPPTPRKASTCSTKKHPMSSTRRHFSRNRRLSVLQTYGRSRTPPPLSC